MSTSSPNTSATSSVTSPTPVSRLLVTGANGFLGKAVVAQSERAGLQVTTCGRSDNVHDFANYHRVDLLQGKTSSLIAGQDAVVHCAGLAHQFGKKGDDPRPFFATNVKLTQRLLQESIKAGVKHFVLISSISVYGPNESGQPFTETDSCNPSGHYGESKLEGERQAIAIAKKHDIRLTIIRMATIYGEGDRGNIHRLINAMDERKFFAIGPGENMKSLIYLDDAARACLIPIENADRQPSRIEVYNVTAPSVKMSNVTDSLATALMRPKPFVLPTGLVTTVAKILSAVSFGKGPFPRIENTISKWLSDLTLDASKFQTDFGFQAVTSLDQGLAKEVAQFREGQEWSSGEWRGKRILDFILAAGALLICFIPMVVIGIIIRCTSKGVAIYWADRVGKNKKAFSMAKFRTMRIDTPELATDQLDDEENGITPVGKFLRKTSLDELPQLWNVLKGDMSIVGSRPPRQNQSELLALRTARGVSQLRPGMTGRVSLDGCDEACEPLKVELDRNYFQNNSFPLDAKIIYRTALSVLIREGVKEGSEEIVEHPQVLRTGSEFTLIGTADCISSVAVAGEQLALKGIAATVIGITATSQINARDVAEKIKSIRNSLFVYRESTNHDINENLQLAELCLPDIVFSEDPEEIRSQLETEARLIAERVQSGKFQSSPEVEPSAIESQV